MRREIDQFPFSRPSNFKCSSSSFPDLFQEVSDLRRCPLAAGFCVSVVRKLSHTLALNLRFYVSAGRSLRRSWSSADLVFPPYRADCWIDTFVPCVSLLDLAKAVSFTRYYVGRKKNIIFIHRSSDSSKVLTYLCHKHMPY